MAYTSINADAFFFHSPNWAHDVSVRRSWRTAITTSAKGVEKRSALFARPRRGMDYTISVLSAGEMNWLKGVLFANVHRIWGLPLWLEPEALLDRIISVPQTYFKPVSRTGFEAAGLWALGSPAGVMEGGDIYNYGSNPYISSTVRTTNVLVSTLWPAGTVCYPAIHCRINPAQELEFTTSAYASLKISADETMPAEVWQVPMIGDASGADTYLSRPVIPLEHNWAEKVTLKIHRPYEVIQFLGIGSGYSNREESDLFFDFHHDMDTPADIAEMTGFFDAMLGRHGAFWLPSGLRDINITSPFSATDTVLSIEDMGWTEFWSANQAVGHHVAIQLPDGTTVYRQIDSAPSATSIELTSAVGIDCSADQLRACRCSFLLPARFDMDEIKLDYFTANSAKTMLKFKTLQTVDS